MGKKNQDWHERKQKSIRRKREILDRMDRNLKRKDFDAVDTDLDEYVKEIKKDRGE